MTFKIDVHHAHPPCPQHRWGTKSERASERASGARGADDEKSKRASELRALRARQRKGFYPRAPRARIDRPCGSWVAARSTYVCL